jgi:TonB-like protein
MRIAVLGFAILAAVSSAPVVISVAQAGDEPARYSLNQERPETGTLIPRALVTGTRIPLDKSYAELSPQQQQTLKADYANMGASDEPPFPVNGLKAVSQAIAQADVSATVEGELIMQVDVNSNGDATSVTTVRSPNVHISRIASSALQQQKYKPAVCRGQPCAMKFVYHVELSPRR